MSLAKLFNKQNEGWFTEKDKLTTTGIAGLTGIGGSIVTGLLANGNKSKAGEVMGKLGDAAGMIPGPIGAVASAALKTIGGLTNAAFGSNLNQQMINNIQNSANKVANTRYNASTVAGLLGEARKNSGFAGFSKKQLGTQGWFSNARDNAYNRLTALGKAAVSARDLNLTNAAQAIDTTMTNNAKRNITAFGGPLNLSGPMEYEIANQQMSNYNIRTNAQAGNLLDNMYAGLYAFGGNIDANGANFSTGLKHVNAGGTHEESPYEGVPMGTNSEGTPNLVEENEVIYNDYVFSDRLKVPVIKVKKGQELQQFEKILRKYKGLSYAAAAKKAEVNSGVDERPNDNIARRGFEFELDVLAQSQELERAIDHAETPEEKEQLRQLTPEQFAQIQAEQQAQEQAMQEQMMQQQAMQQQQQQMSPEEAAMQEQMAQMSPEEQAMMQQQMAAQQQGMSPEEAAMMQAQGYAEGGELGVPTDDQDITGQAAQMEEAPHEQTTMFNAGTPAEEMSTSMLNETIDEIYQYAKEHKNRELLKDARKAKRGTREDKEEFVDDAREDIMMAIEEQEQLVQQQAEQEQALQEQQAVQMSQQETAEETVQADAGQELDAQMQPQVFAQGGNMNYANARMQQQQQLDQMKALDEFMEIIGQQQDRASQQYYQTFLNLKRTQTEQDAIKAYQLAAKLYQQYQNQQNQYGYGGYMNSEPNIFGEGGNADNISAEEMRELYLKYLKKRLGYNTNISEAFIQAEVSKLMESFKDKNDEITLDDLQNLKALNVNKFRNTNKFIRKSQGQDEFTKAITNWEAINNIQGKVIDPTQQGNYSITYSKTPGYFEQYEGLADIAKDKKIADDLAEFAKTSYDYTNRGFIHNNNNGIKTWKKYTLPSDTPSGTTAGYFTPTSFDPGVSPEVYRNSEQYKHFLYNLFKDVASNNPEALKFLHDTGWHSRSAQDQQQLSRANKFIKKGDNNSLSFIIPADTDTDYDAQLFRAAIAGDQDNFFRLLENFNPANITNSEQALLARGMYNGELAQMHTSAKPQQTFYYIPSGQKKVYVNANNLDTLTQQGYTIGEASKWMDINGVDVREIPLTGKVTQDFIKDPFGNVKLIDDPEALKNLKKLDKSSIALENPALGYSVENNEYTLNPTNQEQRKQNYPEYSFTPTGVGLGLEFGALANNLFSPVDTSKGETAISAARQAGTYTPVKAEMIGNYLKYIPYDFNYVNTQARNANQAGLSTIRNMTNGNIGQQLANTITSNYNYITGLGNNYVQGFQYNDKNRERVTGFGSEIAKFNSTADLQAQKANQEAELSANKLMLPGIQSGLALIQSAENAREKSINANLTGIQNLIDTYYTNKWQRDWEAWDRKNRPIPG